MVTIGVDRPPFSPFRRSGSGSAGAGWFTADRRLEPGGGLRTHPSGVGVPRARIQPQGAHQQRRPTTWSDGRPRTHPVRRTAATSGPPTALPRQVTDAIKTRPPRGRTTRPGNAYLVRRSASSTGQRLAQGWRADRCSSGQHPQSSPDAQQRRLGLTVRTMEALGRTGCHQCGRRAASLVSHSTWLDNEVNPSALSMMPLPASRRQEFDVATCRRTASPTMAEVTVRYPAEQRTRSPIRKIPGPQWCRTDSRCPANRVIDDRISVGVPRPGH